MERKTYLDLEQCIESFITIIKGLFFKDFIEFDMDGTSFKLNWTWIFSLAL